MVYVFLSTNDPYDWKLKTHHSLGEKKYKSHPRQGVSMPNSDQSKKTFGQFSPAWQNFNPFK